MRRVRVPGCSTPTGAVASAAHRRVGREVGQLVGQLRMDGAGERGQAVGEPWTRTGDDGVVDGPDGAVPHGRDGVPAGSRRDRVGAGAVQRVTQDDDLRVGHEELLGRAG